MRTLEELINDIMSDAERKCRTAKIDYVNGETDCKAGVYDKWYRYTREDSGRAYDLGWENKNEEVKNEKVTFIEINRI